MRHVALAILLSIGLSVAACDDGGSSGDGTTTQDSSMSQDSVTTDTAVDTTSETETETATAADSTTADTTVDDSTVDDTTVEDTTTEDAEADTVEATEDTAADTTPEQDTTPASLGACDNAFDENQLATAPDVAQTAQTCALSAFTSAQAAADCVRADIGISTECAACFGQILKCAIDNCALQCIGGASPACNDCRAQNCDGAFEACAGISPQL